MTPQRWQSVQRLFEEVLEYEDPARQAAFLAGACDGDDELLACLTGMLQGDARPPAVLEASTAGLLAWLPDARQQDLPHAGPYRLVRELGYGGMGVVYLAERADDQFRRQVALKLMLRSVMSGDSLRRFRNERQILASLEHPNIARLYDGGVSGDGRPYLVMEYVEGVPIDAYCDANRLTVDERLALFTSVCEAVRFAHRNLVVHRDLKPSNILVTARGEVKLLDFGIAKLLDEPVDSEAAVRTRTGVRVLTPAYAAPEQILGQPVSTATDVFSLGVVLYELLTGTRPFPDDATPRLDVARSVLDREPERPSTAVGRALARAGAEGPPLRPAAPDLCLRRGTTATRLRRRLRGDLDTMLLTALRKEPDRRYGSAEAFLDDIKRHLAGLPTRAHPETLRYRARKFIRRHRFGVLASVLILVSLSAGLGSALWQAGETRRQRDAAEQIASFLEGLFASSDPLSGETERLDTLRVRELLARGVRNAQHELQAQPTVLARLLNVIGSVYHNLGLYDEASPLVAQALQMREGWYGTAHPETAESQHELAALRLVMGDYAGADSLYRLALATRMATLGKEDLLVSESLLGLAEVLRARGSFEEAESNYREAVRIRRTVLGSDHAEVAEGMRLLATLLWNAGSVDEARQMLQEALVMSRKTLGDRHPRLAATLQQLAGVAQDQGAFGDAEAYLREALSINDEVLGTSHPRTVQARHVLAVLYEDLARYDEAERLLREILALQRQRFGSRHPETAAALNDLALVLRGKGAFQAAEPFAGEAVRIWEELVGPEHRELATSLSVYASIQKHLGRLDEAERTYRRALAMARKTLGDDHRDTGVLTTHLADVLRARGAYGESEALYREVLARTRRVGGDDHPGVGIVTALLANVLRDAGRCREAEAVYREALAQMSRSLPPGHVRVARAHVGLGTCLAALQRHDEAEAVLLEGYGMVRDQPYDARAALKQLVALYDAWAKPVRSEHFERLLAEIEALP